MHTNSNTWLIWIALTGVAVLTVVPALVQGRITMRWEVPPELTIAAEAIDQFPSELGPWKADENADLLAEPLNDEVIRELGIAGYVKRYYRHKETGEIALVLVMVGQPGPLSRHPARICLENTKNSVADEGKLYFTGASESEPGTFRVLSCESNRPTDVPFQVAYAYTNDGRWDVPDYPRFTYGKWPFVYKVQIVAPRSGHGIADDKDRLEGLLREFSKAFAMHLERFATE